MSNRDHQWKFFEHLWKVEANKAEREFAFKSGCDCCEPVLKQENARLREALDIVRIAEINGLLINGKKIATEALGMGQGELENYKY